MGFFHNYAVMNSEEMKEEVTILRTSKPYKDSNIALMPDAHKGANHACVGFTSTYNDAINVGTVGVDIACRVSAFDIVEGSIDLEKLDEVIRERVPSGFAVRNKECDYSKAFPYEELRCWENIKDKEPRFRRAMGTMGQSNHYISIEGNFLMVHCGSRNLGLSIANYYQKKAIKARDNRCALRSNVTNAMVEVYKAVGATPIIQSCFDDLKLLNNTEPVNDLCYLEGQDMVDYLHDADMMRKWSWLNHLTIAEEIADGMGWKIEKYVSSIHNYVDTKNRIIRKGAISAQDGEFGIIPLSMADGSLIVRGKGNPEWNWSLPHGAGRLYSRKKAKAELSMDDYKTSMEGIFTTCISEATLDECQAAYKPAKEIIAAIGDNAEIVEWCHPLYNYKAS